MTGNPTKSELVENYWLEFVIWAAESNAKVFKFNQALGEKADDPTQRLNYIRVIGESQEFWDWFIDFKLEEVRKKYKIVTK